MTHHKTRKSRRTTTLVSGFRPSTLAILAGVSIITLAGIIMLTLSRAATTPAPPYKLTWAPPKLVNPETIYATDTNNDFKLDSAKDYLIVLPKDRAINTGSGSAYMSVNGGRNVVMIGGKITTSNNINGVVRFTGQTGTIHIEGIHITGNKLGEGFQFQNMPNAIVQFQNILVDELNYNCGPGTAYHHCDLFQIWGGGPKEVRIDRLTGSTPYQAFMLQDAPTGKWTLRNVAINHVLSARGKYDGYTMFDANPKASGMTFSNVYFYGAPADQGIYSLRGGAKPGLSYTPPSTQIVNPDDVGLGYVSPGYANATDPSPTPTPASTVQPTTGDINGDGKVNVFDLSSLLTNWGNSGPNDINGDGKTDIFDLSALLSRWTG